MNASSPTPLRMTVALTPEIDAKMRCAVESGEYRSTDEIVQEALGGWSRGREAYALRTDELRALMQEGMDSGPGVAAEDVYAELETIIEACAAERP